ncbi:hypothetical protein Rumeso_02127 [Rubellimicrobium mesophilum DSM 19309]|uniref:Translocation and assembly module TamB C-terminal domain-containing protein n=1 Tax=Rubellimicrobium mesophilum DSM 19309 TaxID=442562 RepID=A0A017HQ29_9RHOB|nr:translocation/assembly module TamB domain-containing protein [Rubellimicrobium mesophilum]EYD76278.1 hypothetical protein Rumeso_02127 [Rubellimicrobium mesophilum DSM 19309]
MRFLPLLALCALPLPALAQDTQEEDRGFLQGLIEDALSSTARTVRIEGFEGALSSRATVDRLTIADSEGVWLEATALALDWNRSALLRGRIEVEELSAGAIDVIRPPVPDPQAPSPEATPFSLPDLPVSVNIGQLDAERIVLGEALLGQELALTLNGSVNLEGGEGQANLDAQIVEGSEGSLALDASYSNETRVLAVNLDLQEAQGGLAARALSLPGLPSVALHVEGTGPIDDYGARISLATDGEQRIAGDVALQTTATRNGEVTSRAFGLDVRGDVTALLAPDAGRFFGDDVVLRTKGIRREDGSLVLTSLDLRGQAITLDGSAEITPEGWPARIDLTGEIGTEGGPAVPLPGAGDTTVSHVNLDIGYDRSQGEGWTGTFAIDGLARPGLSIDALTLDGGGTIVSATATAPGQFTADLDYTTQGLAFADGSLGEALGADLSGNIDLARPSDGGPLRIRSLTLSGPGLEAQAEGTVAGPNESFLTQSSITFTADDLARFAELTGLDLGGSANATVVSSIRPLDGIFELALQGTTDDLALGIAQLDPLLAGSGAVTLNAARDTAGLRIGNLDLSTDAIKANATANITSGASEARFDLDLTDLGLAFPELSGPGSVTGSFNREADGAATLDADATLPGASVTLDATQAASTLDAEGDRTPGPVTFDARARAEDLARYQSLLATFAPNLPVTPSGGVDLTFSGTTEPDFDTFDVTVQAETQDLRVGIDRLDALLAGAGTLSGRLNRTGLDALTIDDLRVSTDLLTGTVTADLTEDGGTAQLDLSLADVEPVLGGIEGPGRVAGTATRTADGGFDLNLDATLPTGTASIDGTLAPPEQGFAFTGEVNADFDDIAPLGALAGRDLSGAVQADVNGTIRPDLSLFDLTFDATTEDLALGIAPLDALLAGPGTHSGRVARTGPDSFTVEDLRIDTPLLDGTVTAAIENGTGTADLDLSLADVAPVLGGLSGPGRLTGTAEQAQDGTVALDLRATLPTGTATVQGNLAPEQGYQFTGDLAADFSDIAPLGALAGRDLGGAVQATANGTIRPDLSVLDLTFDATTRDLRTGIPQLDPLLAGQGTHSGQVERSPDGGLALAVTTRTPFLNGNVSGTFMEDSGQGSFDLNLPDISVVAPGLAGPASATGTATRAADGTIAVQAQATAPGTTATIDASVAPPEQGYEITGTARIAAANLAPFSTLAGRPLSGAIDATVTGSALPSLARFDLTVDATTQSLGLGIPTLDTLLAGSGTVSARVLKDENGPIRAERLSATFPNITVTAQGDPSGVAFDARLADLGLFVPDFPGPVTATGTAAFNGATSVNASVTGPGGLTAQVTGTIGATPDLRFTGTAPLAIANAFLEPRRLEGPASFDLRLAGTTLDALSGTVSVQDARVSDPSLGEALTDIDGTATLAGGTATVALTGGLASGGRLAVTGPVGLAPPFQADLSITGTGLVIRDPSLYEARGNGQLSVTGPLAGGALIAGAVNLDTVELRVPSSGVGALGDVPAVFHIEPSVPVRQTLARANLTTEGTPATGGDSNGATTGQGFALDILLNAPARVFIRGRGLDAELGGQLRLTGTTRQIIPIGQFSLLRGRLSILGQRFDLTEGQATIQGDFNPYIRLVAQTTARTGTAISIIVEGPLSSPEVTFQSTPELPQDEVLAQLLFGVDIESISPLQAVRLASAVATLAGEGTGVLDDIRGQAGLADFDVTTTESGDIALRLGQYISENVYTDVVVSPQETEATINLDLTPDFTVRAGVSTEGETTLGIYFERDY